MSSWAWLSFPGQIVQVDSVESLPVPSKITRHVDIELETCVATEQTKQLTRLFTCRRRVNKCRRLGLSLEAAQQQRTTTQTNVVDWMKGRDYKKTRERKWARELVISPLPIIQSGCCNSPTDRVPRPSAGSHVRKTAAAVETMSPPPPGEPLKQLLLSLNVKRQPSYGGQPFSPLDGARTAACWPRMLPNEQTEQTTSAERTLAAMVEPARDVRQLRLGGTSLPAG